MQGIREFSKESSIQIIFSTQPTFLNLFASL